MYSVAVIATGGCRPRLPLIPTRSRSIYICSEVKKTSRQTLPVLLQNVGALCTVMPDTTKLLYFSTVFVAGTKATPDLKLKDSGNNTKYIFYGSTALVGLHFLIVEVRRSHSDTPHSVRLLRTSMPPPRFEPAIPALERPQTYSVDPTATGIGHRIKYNKR
jgi:hypothetical protein